MKITVLFIIIATLFTSLNAQDANNYPYDGITPSLSLMNNPALQNMDGKELIDYIMTLDEEVLEHHMMRLKTTFNNRNNDRTKVEETIKVRQDSSIYFYVSDEDELIKSSKMAFTYLDENTIKLNTLKWSDEINDWYDGINEADTNLIWNPIVILSHDPVENWIQEEHYFYFHSSGDRGGFLKFRVEFDEENRQEAFYIYVWNVEEAIWKYGAKINYYYTDFGARAGKTHFGLDTLTNEWIQDSYDLLNYNENNQLINHLTYLDSLMLNDENKITKKIEHEYTDDGSFWRYEKTYNTDINDFSLDNQTFFEIDNEECSIWVDYKNENNVWIIDSKKKEVYDENGKTIELISFEWVENDSIWELDRKIAYFYNEVGDHILSVSSFWNSIKDDWQNSSRLENKYLENYKRAEIQNIPYESIPWFGMLFFPLLFDADIQFMEFTSTYPKKEIGWYEYNPIRGEWELWKLDKHYFTEELITPPSDLIVTVYPNPASEYVIFQADEKYDAVIEMHDINGRLVADQTLKTNEHFSVNQLTNGVYFYKLTLCDDPTKVYHGELVIKLP